MKFLQEIRFWPIISVLGVLLMCTGVYGTTVDPGRQFLEVVNYSDKRIVITVKRVDGSYEHPSYWVAPEERKRFPDALRPGLISLDLVIGTNPDIRTQTKGFQVNNYENKTFLHGKQLTISKAGDHNIKSVRFLHGVWRIKDIEHEYELNISHVNPHFKGSLTAIKTREKATISGTMADQLMSFKIAVPAYVDTDGAQFEMSELRVYPNGQMEGSLNASYMEEGERKQVSYPVRFEVDFQKKELVYKGYKD